MAPGGIDNGAGVEITDGALFARDGVIEQVGKTADLPETADRVIDMRGHVVIPGMVNTHHHVSKSYTGGTSGTECTTVWVATNLISDLSHIGPDHIYCRQPWHLPNWLEWLHHIIGPFISLSELRAA